MAEEKESDNRELELAQKRKESRSAKIRRFFQRALDVLDIAVPLLLLAGAKNEKLKKLVSGAALAQATLHLVLRDNRATVDPQEIETILVHIKALMPPETQANIEGLVGDLKEARA